MLIAMCSFAAAASAQTTVTLSTPDTQINADVTIQGGASGMTNFSNSDVLASKVSSNESYMRRIVFKIDTQNTIPANATIQSAKLYLVLKNAESSENRPLTAFNVTQSFAKSEINWYYFRSGQAWANRGGDLSGSFGTTYVSNAEGSTYGFDLTKLVQQAVNGEFGSRYTRVALVDTGGSSAGNVREFHSTRSANVAARPRLVVVYGSSPVAAPPPPPSTGTTLRVMQWNIHKTKGSDGVCNADRTVNTILSFHPDVVSMNEVDYFSGACGWNLDQGEQLRTPMQKKSGVPWYRQSDRPAVNTGDVLLSRYPLTTSSSTLLSNYRAVAQVGIVVNGRNVNLFSTHIEWDNSSWRAGQIAEAGRWMSTFAEPRIMMGDFNTWPNTSDYYIIATPYQDAWVAGLKAGAASSYNGTGTTEGQSRLDYVFFSRISTLALNSVTVPNTLVNGIRPSDHDPVVAVFTVK